MSACTQANCRGTVLGDGYCDTCGFAAAPAPRATPAAAAAPSIPSPAPAARSGAGVPTAHAPQRSVDMGMVGAVCPSTGCGGTVLADGYCNTCGLFGTAPAPATPAGTTQASAATVTPSLAAPQAPSAAGSGVGVIASTASRRQAASRRSANSRGGLGFGLVHVPPTPVGDPAAAVMSDEKIARVLGAVPEADRYCNSCGQSVGRGDGTGEGRVKGFCGACRTEFNFITNAPSLTAGTLVAGQYEILGPIAHGGMGWIYLGRDSAVSGRWVVLKGLLNEDDADAIASAVAERQFLAQIEHGSIVNIYNFVTHGGAGYIVMEYVGGESLNSKLKDRRRANGGKPDPLPVTQAIAYMIEVLPALGYLHRLGLVYNDLKPANVMATDDDVKLIDVGGVMRADDTSAAIFGTQGFQAPEVASAGPSVPSDLYTVGRTLAVMTLSFRFHDGQYLHMIPPVAEQPLLGTFESFHRFLLKATARHPDDRFQTAEEMREQLVGVLREIVAITTSVPHPTPSSLFGGDQLTELLADDSNAAAAPTWTSLPAPRVSPADPAAGFLLDLPDRDPRQALDMLAGAVEAGQVPWTIEGSIVNARLLVALQADPSVALRGVADVDPWDWRIKWVTALSELDRGANSPESTRRAAELFSEVWTELPGEIAPKLGVALAAESAGDFARAAALYETIVATDPTYVTASFGLARCRVASGDRVGAVEAYGGVPISSAGYFDAQVARARTLTTAIPGGGRPAVGDLRVAAETVERLQLDSVERARISVEILEDAVDGLGDGSLQPAPDQSLFGEPLTERGARSGLERLYRELARVAPTPAERRALVDKANRTRPVSFL